MLDELRRRHACWTNFEGEAILSADLDLGEIAKGKYNFDVAGHYARPDVFQLSVNERAMPPVVREPEIRQEAGTLPRGVG